VGLVAAWLGVTAAHAVTDTSLAQGSTVLIPITAGVETRYASVKIWNNISSRSWILRKICRTEK
jgi:hypothetical protein